MELKSKNLVELGKLGEDGYSCSRFRDADCCIEIDTIYLSKDGFSAVYILGLGLVIDIDQEYRFTQIISNDHIVAGITHNKKDYYGCYSIPQKNLIIPPQYSNHEFWLEHQKYMKITYRDRQG
jgi:hypothetical protein